MRYATFPVVEVLQFAITKLLSDFAKLINDKNTFYNVEKMLGSMETTVKIIVRNAI